MALPRELSERIERAYFVLHQIEKAHGFLVLDTPFKAGDTTLQIRRFIASDRKPDDESPKWLIEMDARWSGSPCKSWFQGLQYCQIDDVVCALPHLNAFIDWQREQIAKREQRIGKAVSDFDSTFRYMIVTEANKAELFAKLNTEPQLIRLPNSVETTYTIPRTTTYNLAERIFMVGCVLGILYSYAPNILRLIFR